MNFFSFHVGDYVAATAHLSWDEDMAYTRLIRVYYQTEKPIPKDKAYRLSRATTPAQRAAVDSVLEEFFTLQPDGYHQTRCETEIAKFQGGAEEREQKEANERERVIRHRERRSAIFNDLRTAGVVPPWNAKTTELQRLHKAHCNAPVTRTGALQHEPVTRTGALQNVPVTRTDPVQNAPDTATQEPIPNNQYPITNTNTEVFDTQTPLPPEALVCVVVKNAGIGNVNPQHPQLAELLANGASVQEFEDAARIAVANGKGFAYCLGIVKGRMEDANRATKTRPQQETFRERDDRLAAERIAEFMPSIAAKQPRNRNVIDITPVAALTVVEA